MRDFEMLLVTIGLIALIVLIIKAIINGATNRPTWQGIIISALLGMLPFYLVMCWFGWMGESRDNR